MTNYGHRELVHFQFAADGAAVPRVRHAIAAVLTGWALMSLADDVAACVSELVGNIVQHAMPPGRGPNLRGAHRAAPQADILLSREPDSHLVLEVRDQDPRLPEKRRLAELPVLASHGEIADSRPDAWLVSGLAESGRGLAIVEASCDQLTWYRLPGAGKAVRCCWRLASAACPADPRNPMLSGGNGVF
jgi:anti-sigma regulatory factor (Ser/Thr protein kinase)